MSPSDHMLQLVCVLKEMQWPVTWSVALPMYVYQNGNKVNGDQSGERYKKLEGEGRKNGQDHSYKE